jgi:hypothetical protein
MKLLRVLLSITIFAFIFSSCEKNDDNDPEATVEKLLGIWKVEETSSTYGTQNYNVSISKDLYIQDVLSIYNFFGLGSFVRVVGEVVDDKLVLEPQNIDGFKIYGEGEIMNDYKRIEFAYTVEELATAKGSSQELVTAVYTLKD